MATARSNLAEAVNRAYVLARASGVRHRVALCREKHDGALWAKRPHFVIAPTGHRTVAHTQEPPC